MNLITNASRGQGRIRRRGHDCHFRGPGWRRLTGKHSRFEKWRTTGSQRYWKRYAGRDPGQDLRSVFHDQIRGPGPRTCRRARNYPKSRRHNQCRQRSAGERGRQSAAAAAHEGESLGTYLVVEDEDALRKAVSEMLRRTGWTVIEAADGPAGIDYFRMGAQNVDVVRLDLTLPGMPGTRSWAHCGAHPGGRDSDSHGRIPHGLCAGRR